MRYTRTELGLFDAFALILAGLGAGADARPSAMCAWWGNGERN